MRFRLWPGVVTVLLLPLTASLAGAEQVVETWRSPVGLYPRDLSASPVPDSCWVGYSNSEADVGPVAQLAADGTVVRQMATAAGPLAVNPADGSVWLVEWTDGSAEGALLHLAADGSELLRITSPVAPASMAVDAMDGSCWIAREQGESTSTGGVYYGGLTHIAADGSALLNTSDGLPRWSVSVNPGDGSVWVAEGANAAVVHLTREGAELYRGLGDAGAVCVDSGDGSCWVGGTGYVAHLAADGTELSHYGSGAIWVPENPPPPACGVAVNTQDHSCWITYQNRVVHLAADGTFLSRAPGFDFSIVHGWFAAPDLAVSPADGSCWVADTGHNQVARLAVVEGPTQHFLDVPPDFWAFAEIEACTVAGIVSGYPDGGYRPDVVIGRDQMAVYIVRALVGPSGDAAIPDPTTVTFSDVKPEHWAYKQIEYCAAHGLVGGYPGGAYRPNEPVNRGQMAVYIARAIATPTGDVGVPDPPAAPTFPDVTADSDWAWCHPHVEYLAAEGIVQGYADGYRPEVTVTRDQMAVYIARAFHLPL